MALLMINLHFIISFQLFPLISPVETSRLTSRRFVLIKLLFILVSSKETDPTTCHCKKYSSPKSCCCCFVFWSSRRLQSRSMLKSLFKFNLFFLSSHKITLSLGHHNNYSNFHLSPANGNFIPFHSIRRILSYNLEHKAEESA